MPIRKTGSATGQITGIEDTEATDEEARGFLREAQLRTSPWTAKDERELAAENDDAAPGL